MKAKVTGNGMRAYAEGTSGGHTKAGGMAAPGRKKAVQDAQQQAPFGRCCAVHDRTGRRCPEPIGSARAARTFGLCRKHLGRGHGYLQLRAYMLDDAVREWLIAYPWQHAREICERVVLKETK